MVNYYSYRRLAPFSGVVAVVELEDSRAITFDGINWQFQFQCHLNSPYWDECCADSGQVRYFSFAVWSTMEGVAQLPTKMNTFTLPLDDIMVRLVAAISHRTPPYPFNDVYELWSLHQETKLPVALLASSDNPESLQRKHETHWTAIPPGLQRHQETPVMVDELIQTVRAQAGEQPQNVWFLRRPDGSGTRLKVLQNDAALSNETLDTSYFPEMLLRLEGEQTQDMLDAYVAWMAPQLLCLPMRYETRSSLEPIACRNARGVARYHKLYPELIDEQLITSARVEAQIRQTNC